MSGQSIQDRIIAAKHSISGQGLAKSVCKATTEEVMGPKKKHLDCKWKICIPFQLQLRMSDKQVLKTILVITDLIQCTHEPNVSVPQLANLLIERTQTTNWVVVFKALITLHNLMNYGNEVITNTDDYILSTSACCIN